MYTRVKLDYEQNKEFNISILAYDHGIPQMDESFGFIIHVKDVDEFPPVFSKAEYNFKIFANLEQGELVGQVSVIELVVYLFR